MLPWDADIDVGLLGEEVDNVDLVSELKKTIKNITVVDDRPLSGRVTVIRNITNSEKTHVDLMLFYNYFGWRKRPGIVSWLLPVNYYIEHTFPDYFLKSPLPTAKFGGLTVNVPRNSSEVIKHLYKFDWWKEVRPVGC